MAGNVAVVTAHQNQVAEGVRRNLLRLASSPLFSRHPQISPPAFGESSATRRIAGLLKQPKHQHLLAYKPFRPIAVRRLDRCHEYQLLTIQPFCTLRRTKHWPSRAGLRRNGAAGFYTKKSHLLWLGKFTGTRNRRGNAATTSLVTERDLHENRQRLCVKLPENDR